MTDARARAIRSNHETWAALVDMVVDFRGRNMLIDADTLARDMKKSTGSIVAKINSILSALSDGVPPEKIIEEGETILLQRKAQKRAVASDGSVNLTFRVAPELKEAVLSDFDRIAGVMGYGSRENVLDWLHALMLNIEDSDIRHLAGEGKR